MASSMLWNRFDHLFWFRVACEEIYRESVYRSPQQFITVHLKLVNFEHKHTNFLYTILNIEIRYFLKINMVA